MSEVTLMVSDGCRVIVGGKLSTQGNIHVAKKTESASISPNHCQRSRSHRGGSNHALLADQFVGPGPGRSEKGSAYYRLHWHRRPLAWRHWTAGEKIRRHRGGLRCRQKSSREMGSASGR